jgi:cytochrome c oxidase subunit 2
VPQLGGSVTAMPGYDNKSWVRADTPGTYSGAGTIINGTNYASMTTTVHVVPASLFEAWVNGKQTQIAEAMTALGDERSAGKEAVLLGEGKAVK